MPVALLVRRTRRALSVTPAARRLARSLALPLALPLAFVAAGLTAAPARAAAQGTPSNKPTVAIMYFTNGAITKAADYAPLSKGLAEMLITELSGNTNIRVVERDRIESLIQEQNLTAGGRIDQATAVKSGKILGALHMLMGSFVIDTKNRIRMDVRAINTETSELEYATTVNGKADDMLELLTQLAEKVNKGLKLPDVPGTFQQGTAVGAKGPNQLKSMMLLSRALEQQDRKNNQAAIALYKESLQANPDNTRAKTLLASLERGSR